MLGSHEPRFLQNEITRPKESRPDVVRNDFRRVAIM